MKTIKSQCLYCGANFEAPLKEINRGYGKYCSIQCSNNSKKGRTLFKVPNATCAYCGIEFHKNLSSKTKSKSGLYFCNRSHKDLAQRIGGIKEIQPYHYGNSTPKNTYRTLALRNLPNKCNDCGYSKYVEVLDVHHKDHNHSNNELKNLEILCPTCHTERHFLSKSGRFTGK